jgi:septum formation protein
MLVLASASPQRSAIFKQLGFDFVVDPADVDEHLHGEPHDVALGNALAKARRVASRHPDAVVVGADTVVALDGELYGKPASAAEAHRMLTELRGHQHVVTTGVAVIVDGRELTFAASTAVTFRRFGQDLLERYLESGEWADRAGGYAIQGLGAGLVAAIDGDWYNVVGFPVAAFLDLVDRECILW